MSRARRNAEWTEFLRLFELPEQPGTYLLGSYARYVTLYSQQVRALNLVAALLEARRIGNRAEVAVVGAGAAGLTAAAAAAHYAGARVTLVERLGQPMSLQRNNRQRWLHPHIYDWPNQSLDSNRAGLPILDWQAGYAEVVARQITSGWERILEDPSHTIRPYDDAVGVTLRRSSKRPALKWNGHPSHTFDAVILAVGFGLEPLGEHQWSYWEEDAIDAGIRRTGDPRRWLIYGVGDSALTDLMRLCIDRFRHEELPELFRGRREFESVRLDLLSIQKDQQCAESAAALSGQFERLETNGLEEMLRGRLRSDVSVSLCTPTEYQYDPRAATINRLMLRLLSRLGAYEHIVVPPGKRETTFAKLVGREDAGPPALASEKRPGQSDRTPAWHLDWHEKPFDRVLIRGGPKWAMEESFPRIWATTKTMRKTWEDLRLGDRTRTLRWAVDRFDPQGPRPSPEFMTAAEPFGVCAKGVKVAKEILSDGSAIFTIHVRGLTNLARRKMVGVRLKLTSVVGIIGQPQLDAQAEQLGTWEPDREPLADRTRPLSERLETERRRLANASGLFRFLRPLPAGKPVSFGLKIQQLNTDALTKWDFDALYGAKEKNFDGARLDVESFFRHVWFPIETLAVSVTLPESNPDINWRVFGYSHRQPFSTVAGDRSAAPEPRHLPVRDGVLHWRPPEEFEKERWPALDRGAAANVVATSNDRTFTIVVTRPEIGTCYAIEWKPLDRRPARHVQALERRAQTMRQAMLRYGRQRRGAAAPARERFARFAQALWKAYHDDRPYEQFEVTLLTYDKRDRRLKVIDGWRNVADPGWRPEEFQLPFGVGLAGACFKRADRVFLHVHDGPAGEGPRTKGSAGPPDYFIEVPGHPPPGVIVAVPLDHPDFDGSFDRSRRSQQCIGVVDITSNLPDAALGKVVRSASRSRTLEGAIPRLCRAFTSDLKELIRA